MEYKSRVIFCLLLLTGNKVITKDFDDKSIEDTMDLTLDGQNNTSVEIQAVPDSHEAMNNRDNHGGKHKTKRSYEFLLGLVNNNSRYEVTKKEPTSQMSPQNILSELGVEPTNELLEILLKIASHPDQWSKVHKLLRKLDIDMQRSKKLVHSSRSTDRDDFQNQNWQRNTNKEKFHKTYKNPSANNRFEGKVQSEYYFQKPNTWEMYRNVNSPSTNTNIDELESKMNRYTGRIEYNPEEKAAFRKQFSYHKVTGKPLFVDKPSKAYIAVSIIAPKIDAKVKNDAELEKQLEKLKPWEKQRDSF